MQYNNGDYIVTTPTNRNYPDPANYEAWYAAKAGIDPSAVQRDTVPSTDDVRGVIGKAQPGGVSPITAFDGYVPIDRIDNPADGINDGANYVVFFIKESDGTHWKAINADIDTLTQLTSGPEYDKYHTWIL